MTTTIRPRIRARVCEACHIWPCRCRREPAVPVYVEPQFRVERCCCGNFIVAYDLTDKGVTQAVEGHNRTVGHELWRGTWT